MQYHSMQFQMGLRTTRMATLPFVKCSQPPPPHTREHTRFGTEWRSEWNRAATLPRSSGQTRFDPTGPLGSRQIPRADQIPRQSADQIPQQGGGRGDMESCVGVGRLAARRGREQLVGIS